MRFLLPWMTVAMGVRGFPGSGATLGDFIGKLRPGKVAALPKILSSMLQNDASSSWMAADSYTTVISNLTTNLINVLKSEHATSQGEVYSLMNNWGQWVSFVEESLTVASQADKHLYNMLKAEQTASKNFYDAVSDFEKILVKVMNDCTEQSTIEGFNSCVTIESCPPTVDYHVIAPSGEGAAAIMEMSAAEHIAKWTKASQSCTTLKGEVLQFWVYPNTYDALRDARVKVGNAFSARKRAICGDASCESLGNTHKPFGLQSAFRQVCSSQGALNAERALIEGSSNADSLAERNYELDALYTVECLLTSLNKFTNGEYKNSDAEISKLVSTCESGAKAAENENILYQSDDESGTDILGTDSGCFTGENSTRTDSDIISAMQHAPIVCAGSSTVEIGLGELGWPGMGGAPSVPSTGIAGHIAGDFGSADSFEGNVEQLPAWEKLDLSTGTDCNWYCQVPPCDEDFVSSNDAKNVCEFDVASLFVQIPVSENYNSIERSSRARDVSKVGDELRFSGCFP